MVSLSSVGRGGMRVQQQAWWLNLSTLAISAPFLLFPTQFLPATIVALGLIAGIWVWGRHKTPVTPLNIPLLIWMMMVGIGALVSADPNVSLPKLTSLILGLTVWRFVTLYGAQRGMWQLFFWLGGGFILLGVLGAEWQSKLPAFNHIIAQLPQQLISLPGAPTDGIHANQLAAIILIYLPICVAWWLRHHTNRQRINQFIWTAIILLLIAILLLTQSRMGWGGLLVGLLLFTVGWQQTMPAGNTKKQFGKLLTLSILVGIIGGGWLMVRYLPAILETPNTLTPFGSFGSLQERMKLWQWGLEGVSDFPLTGMGLGTFRVVARRLYPVPFSYRLDISHAHNIFLQVALDVGIPGLVAYISLLLIAGALAWRLAHRFPHFRPQSLGILASLVALHSFGIADALAPGAKPAILIWWLLGSLTNMVNSFLKKDQRH